jgi:ribosome-interacting GTPase 1
MMEFEDIQIQLVDTPPVSPESPPWLFHIMRTADILAWMLDLSDDNLLETTEQTQTLLQKANIALASPESAPSPSPLAPSPSPHVPDPQPPVPNPKKVLRLGAKADAPQATDRLAILRELIGEVEVLPVSAEHHTGLEELKRRLFAMLEVIRVYTKKPGKPVEMRDPVILPIGATVTDAAYHLHKDFAHHLQFARLWHCPSSMVRSAESSPSAGYDGQRVERGHVLADKDILEFHA